MLVLSQVLSKPVYATRQHRHLYISGTSVVVLRSVFSDYCLLFSRVQSRLLGPCLSSILSLLRDGF